MRPKYYVAMAIVIICALVLIFAGYQTVLNTESTSATITKTNTSFETFDAKTPTGDNFSFTSDSKITMFEVFAEWCFPCRTSVPQAVKFSNQHPELQVIGIALRDIPDRVLEFQEKYGKFNTTIMSNNQVETNLGISNAPQTLFVVGNEVKYRIYGQASKQDLEKTYLLIKRELARSN